MYAERFILETNVSGKLKGMTLLPANKKVEAIFLMLNDRDKKKKLRHPHADIAGKMKIAGNLIETVTETDWNLSR